MASNWYASRNDLKTRLGLASTDTTDDALMDIVLEAVSREIETHCKRWFYPRTQTRYYTALYGQLLLVDDLLSVSTLKTLTLNTSGTRTYGDSWAAVDYDLEPYNALNATPPQPYHGVRKNPEGAYSFPTDWHGVEIVGSWGYYDVRVTSSATLAEVLDTSETGVDVSSGTAFKVGQTVLIDSEQMFISAIATNTLTVTRAVNGTTAATHANGAAIGVYEYPVVSEACLFQTALDYRGKDAPYGVSGGGEFRQQIAGAGLHPWTIRMLKPFLRVEVG